MDKGNNSLISVVVPVYNVESYLEECVQSILSQDYTKTEIILVDDGSKDNSGVICDNYAQDYPNIKVVHKVNGGLSDARNAGIQEATGEYIVFIDSDDVIAVDMLSRLYESIVGFNSDVAVCGLAHFFEGEEINYRYGVNDIVLSSKDAVINFLYQKEISPSSCGKMYKKTLFNDIKYPVGMVFEDNKVTFEILTLASRIVYIDCLLYGYRHRRNSITTSKFAKRDFDIIKIGKYVLDNIDTKDEELFAAAICYQVTNAMRVYLGATEEFIDDEYFKYAKNFLENNAKKVFKDTKIRTKLKAALLLYLTRMPRKLLIFIHSKINQWK